MSFRNSCRITAVSLVLLLAGGLSAAARTKAPPRAKASSVAARKQTAAKRNAKGQPARRKKVNRIAPAKAVHPAIAALPPFPEFLGPLIPPRVPPPPIPGNHSAAVTKLLENAYSLIGTPYRRGGTTPATGFDCSGFVRYVFQTTFPITLSPSSTTQFHAGAPVPKEELRAGDLVFFRSRSRGWHVGIYVGDGSFIHSPRRNRSVKVTPLLSPYFRRYFVGARRIPLPEMG